VYFLYFYFHFLHFTNVNVFLVHTKNVHAHTNCIHKLVHTHVEVHMFTFHIVIQFARWEQADTTGRPHINWIGGCVTVSEISVFIINLVKIAPTPFIARYLCISSKGKELVLEWWERPPTSPLPPPPSPTPYIPHLPLRDGVEVGESGAGTAAVNNEKN
jgi:hypothetical protein